MILGDFDIRATRYSGNDRHRTTASCSEGQEVIASANGGVRGPDRYINQEAAGWWDRWRIIVSRLLFREEGHPLAIWRFQQPEPDRPGYCSRDVPIARCGHPGCAHTAAAAVVHWRVVNLTHRVGREPIRAAAFHPLSPCHPPPRGTLILRFIFRGGNGVFDGNVKMFEDGHAILTRFREHLRR